MVTQNEKFETKNNGKRKDSWRKEDKDNQI